MPTETTKHARNLRYALILQWEVLHMHPLLECFNGTNASQPVSGCSQDRNAAGTERAALMSKIWHGLPQCEIFSEV
ncbi:hypothetical protein VM1G_11538 [Cytospora mali]|uniref:Uncharacterized protein n=1 Tax=Cytospora mali TaxID=578113 RepID=A0A194VXG6_CYTMA|nr:hypothetical protein VM1G_11538 [Valsa mali]